MPLPQLSVVIVNYNGVSFLKECFNSLRDKLRGISFEIIVVDNNSEDESCHYIKQNFPDVRLIESKQNLGFGKANNLGVKNAKGNTILLLNNDTILLNSLLPAIETLYNKTENGIVAINMLDGEKQYISAIGKFPSPFRMIRISFLKDRRKDFKTGKFIDDLYDVDWVCGAFMLIRKTDYEAVNGFDTDYFMYVEDVDLCKKMRDIGKKCVFRSDLSYIHFVGFNKSREHLLLKGYEIYAYKHFDWFGKIIAKIMISINRAFKTLKGVL
jgi:GT2 family glycosyltransferase